MATSQVFKGSSAELVDQLVEASLIRAPANSTYTGAGRELVPFFDMHEPVGNASMMGSLEGPGSRRAGNGARGSPRKAAAGGRNPHNKPESPSGSRNNSTSPSHRRGNHSDSPQPGRTSPRKAHKASPPQAVPAPTSSSAPAFRCPGFSPSPKPEMVPLPTFGLLQRAVARGIASSCKTSFSHGVSGMLPALQVAA